jgi:hypothetical protein
VRPKGTPLEKRKTEWIPEMANSGNRRKARTNRGKAKHDQGQRSDRHHVESDEIRRDETMKAPKKLSATTAQMRH